MKKIFIILTLLTLIGGALFAQSTNSTVELLPGFNFIRTPFLDGTNAMSIQDIFDTSLLNRGVSAGVSDMIQFWNPVSFKYERYFVHSGVGKGSLHKMGKWIDNNTYLIASNTVPPSTAFFFVNISTSTVNVVISGDAVSSETGSLEILEGFNGVANPFTSEWELNAWPTNWIELGAVAGSGPASADQILLWDPVEDKFDTYFLHNGLGKNNAAKAGKWCSATDRSIADITIGITQGFFFSRPPGAGSLNLILEQQQ